MSQWLGTVCAVRSRFTKMWKIILRKVNLSLKALTYHIQYVTFHSTQIISKAKTFFFHFEQSRTYMPHNANTFEVSTMQMYFFIASIGLKQTLTYFSQTCPWLQKCMDGSNYPYISLSLSLYRYIPRWGLGTTRIMVITELDYHWNFNQQTSTPIKTV